MLAILIGYLTFAVGTVFGDASSSAFDRSEDGFGLDSIAILGGACAQFLCIALFISAIIGMLTNIPKTSPKHTKIYVISLLVSLSIIQFGLVFLSHYGV